MSKNEFKRKTIMFIPSLIISVAVFGMIAVFSGGTKVTGFSRFLSYIFKPEITAFLIRSLPLILFSILISIILIYAFSFPEHSSSGDMWFSFLHGIFVSMPVFLFLFLLMFIFSNTLKVIPARGIFDIVTLLIPSVGIGFIFALYVSFKIRYYKKTEKIIAQSKAKRTLIYSFEVFSSETGFFLTLLFITEFFLYSGGIGYGIGYSFEVKNIIDICAVFLYASFIFIVLRYIFYLIAFIIAGKEGRTA